MTQNLLHQETSPYLLQHAENPVHWRPWGPEALTEARAHNRPILLSVGYAACHWCHVMAHESFEDADTAAVMNELFVNIKVDREERPDIDAIYQHALMLLGQQGGWPLTMFLTPDGRPFWGGTYFPPENRYGRPGFRDVLRAIADFWREKPDRVAEAVQGLSDALAGLSQARSGTVIPIDVNGQIAHRLTQEVDRVNGGIGQAPKFPNPTILELLWRAWRRDSDTECRDCVLLTLRKMCHGGIYDHLGGGFARYSTDAGWLVPHFEKMLYDNAQLIDLLAAAWQDTRDPLFAARIAETVEWVQREMIAEGGGFAATLDADSEGVEGKFYVWTKEEIDRLLGSDAALFAAAYDVTPSGNWEGRTILNRNHPAGPFDEEEEARLARCRDILLDARGTRIRPGWDDKVLADWNGLMIAALANAGAVFDRAEWLQLAITAFHFVLKMMGAEGRLWHSCRNGRLRQAAMLDDYAMMARAAVALYETTGEPAYIQQAEDWINVLDRHFRDDKNGGYFATADDAEALIVRRKTAADHATPSGNGILAEVLARLFYLTGEDVYRARAEEIIAAFSGEIEHNFFPLAALINASETLHRCTQIVIVGTRGESATDALIRVSFQAPQPLRLVNVIAPDQPLPPGHPAAGKFQVDTKATAYVCTGPTCSLPLTDPEGLAGALSQPPPHDHPVH